MPRLEWWRKDVQAPNSFVAGCCTRHSYDMMGTVSILEVGGMKASRPAQPCKGPWVLAVIGLMLIAPAAIGQTHARSSEHRGPPPDFADFPATARFEGKPAPVRLVTTQARKYRTMLRDGARDGPNFAGRYTIAQWGCGAGCVQFAIIDAKTGDVYFPPFYVAIVADPDVKMDQIPEPLQFKPDSKLLIVSGARNEKGGGTYYYKWDNNRIGLIASKPPGK